MLGRLNHLEEQLADQSKRLESLLNGLQYQQALNDAPVSLPETYTPQPHKSPPLFRSSMPEQARTHDSQSSICSPSLDVDLPPMTIPIGHSTTTESLLSSNNVKSLLGDFPRDIFMRSETKRSLPDNLSFGQGFGNLDDLPTIEPEITNSLVETYFENVHAEIPILHQGDFLNLYNKSLEVGLSNDVDSALCLVVLALGSIATTKLDMALDDPIQWAPGSDFMACALRILIRSFLTTFGTSVALPQALLLAAKYFGYLLLPLQSWRLVHMASTNIQHLWNQ